MIVNGINCALMHTSPGTLTFILDESQERDMLDGDRCWLLHVITCHLKRRVRAARRRGERI